MKYAKSFFYFGITGLILFEIANVYFIMPMPGSQDMNSIDLAYFLYRWRWVFRIFFLLLLIFGFLKSSWKRKWIPFIPLLIAGLIIYMFNFRMSADQMFRQPSKIIMVNAIDNKVDSQRLVIGVVINDEAKAYPIQILGYHHQVIDSVGGKPAMITYCTVCRTGRVFEPSINGQFEKFRLVGMDHFNAMFEDATTKSWWRQATGEAITGKRKGIFLPEMESSQLTLGAWLKLHPNSLVMQPDPLFSSSYDSTMAYEKGKSRKTLTGTDSLSWKKKSWVVGVKFGGQSRAYDWNKLKENGIIEDTMAGKSIFILLGSDSISFAAFEKSGLNGSPRIEKDTIFLGNKLFRLDGRGIDTTFNLRKIPAFQEFWHSWKEFNKVP